MVDATQAASGRRIAMLIDGDNAQASLIENILAEPSKYGMVTIRRIYGDWTEPTMKSWKDTLQNHAIQPIQQFRYTTGKNATDSALIIDAMDLLHEPAVGGFCLVSSDSDYTRLATRIREKGLFVMGIGKNNTPRAFVSACEVFVYTENLAPETKPSSSATASRRRKSPAKESGEPVALLKRAIDMAAQDSDWASLGAIGNTVRQLDPGFDPRTYGHRQLSQLVKSYPRLFEVSEETTPGGSSHIYVKLKS